MKHKAPLQWASQQKNIFSPDIHMAEIPVGPVTASMYQSAMQIIITTAIFTKGYLLSTL